MGDWMLAVVFVGLMWLVVVEMQVRDEAREANAKLLQALAPLNPPVTGNVSGAILTSGTLTNWGAPSVSVSAGGPYANTDTSSVADKVWGSAGGVTGTVTDPFAAQHVGMHRTWKPHPEDDVLDAQGNVVGQYLVYHEDWEPDAARVVTITSDAARNP